MDRDSLLEHLTAETRALWLELEEYAGLKVSVAVVLSETAPQPTEAEPVACEVKANGATLLFPEGWAFDEGAILHELLHIRRFWPGRTPSASALYP